MYDIVIRGGTIIDGSGQGAFTGDVAIGGGRIAEIGGKAGPARREIDAAGLLVTPGWVDVHTHYDGQATLGAVGAGAFGMNSDFDDEEYELAWMTRLAKETARPVWFLLTDRYEDPTRWRRLLGAVHAARKDGAPLTAQIAGRPIGVMMGIGTALNPFTVRPSYRKFEKLSIAEQRAQL